MRTKNAALNLVLYLVYEVLLFVVGILFPRFIILTYGSEVNGLASTITRLLSLVNLIQAGAVGAAVFQMLGPVANNDYEEQSAILYASRKYYNKVTATYFVISIIIGFFFSFQLKNDTLHFYEIFISFVIFALSGSFTLFFTSQFDIYITPHQKSFYLKFSSIAGLIVNYGLLIITLILKLPFIFIYIDVLLGNATCALLNYYFFKRLTKGKIKNNPSNKKFVIPNKRYLLLSTIGTEMVSALPQIIISNFVGLIYTSVFSVYSMIFVSMTTILSSINYSFSGTFGNLVKTSTDDKVKDVFNCISLITLALGTVLAACTAFLIMPFVRVYTASITDVDYYYPILGALVAFYICILSFRLSVSFVPTVYGYFKSVCWITVISGVISSILSLVCTLIWGMPFVMVGLIMNQLICSIGIIIILKNKLQWFSIIKLIRRLVTMIVVIIVFLAAHHLISLSISSIWKWIICAIVCFVMATIIEFGCCLLFERKDLLSVFSYVKMLVSKKSKA